MFLHVFGAFWCDFVQKNSGLRAQEEVTFVGNRGILYSLRVSILALLVNIELILKLQQDFVVFRACNVVYFKRLGPFASSSSVPPGETRVRTRCQKEVCGWKSELGQSEQSPRLRSAACLLRILDSHWLKAGRKSGLVRRLRLCTRIG